MASIHKRKTKSGHSYLVTWRVGEGKDRRQESETFTDHEEAKRHRRKMEEQVESRRVGTAKPETVFGYLDDWIKAKQADKKKPISPKSAEGYKRNIEIAKRGLRGALKAEVAERLRLGRLSTAQLERAYDYLLEDGKLLPDDKTGPLSKQSVLHVHRVLHKAFGDAAGRLKLIPFNPASNAEHPTPKRGKNKSYKSKVRPFTKDELLLLLHRATDKVCPPDTYVMCALLLVAGLRRGELAGLADDAIGYEAGKLKVFRSVVEVDGKPLLQDGTLDEDEDGVKTEAGVREITIPAMLVAVLRDHRKRVLEAALAFGKGYQRQPLLIFPGFDGSPQNPKLITRRMERLIARAKIDRATKEGKISPVHSWRHTHGTLLFHDQKNVKLVQERLGHADPSITMQLYVHGMVESDEAAAEFFGKLITK